MLKNDEDLKSLRKKNEGLSSQPSGVKAASYVLADVKKVLEKTIARLDKSVEKTRSKLYDLSKKVNILEKEKKDLEDEKATLINNLYYASKDFF